MSANRSFGSTPTLKTHGGQLIVVDYDPTWPDHFARISAELQQYLTAASVQFTTIEHVGSTSVHGCAAKPNIDIEIIVPDQENAEKAREALIHEPPPEGHYKCYGDGGIRGRISMKFHDRRVLPDRSVYIMREDDPDGLLNRRAHQALRDTLRKPENEHIKDEYGAVKKQLVLVSTGLVQYGAGKKATIRKILKVARWSDADIDAKDSLDQRGPNVDDERPY